MNKDIKVCTKCDWWNPDKDARICRSSQCMGKRHKLIKGRLIKK